MNYLKCSSKKFLIAKTIHINKTKIAQIAAITLIFINFI